MRRDSLIGFFILNNGSLEGLNLKSGRLSTQHPIRGLVSATYYLSGDVKMLSSFLRERD